MADAVIAGSTGSRHRVTPGSRDVLVLMTFTLLQVAAFHVAFDALDRRDPYTLWARISAVGGVLLTAAVFLRLHSAHRRHTVHLGWAGTYAGLGAAVGGVYALVVLPLEFDQFLGPLFFYAVFHAFVWLPILGVSLIMATMLNTREQKTAARGVAAGPFVFAAAAHGIALLVMVLITARLAEEATRAHSTPGPGTLLVAVAAVTAALLSARPSR